MLFCSNGQLTDRHVKFYVSRNFRETFAKILLFCFSDAGVISIRFPRFPHFPAEADQLTDWEQKLDVSAQKFDANFAGAKLKNFVAKRQLELQFSLKKPG
jgi:hypothetical protein